MSYLGWAGLRITASGLSNKLYSPDNSNTSLVGVAHIDPDNHFFLAVSSEKMHFKQLSTPHGLVTDTLTTVSSYLSFDYKWSIQIYSLL